ncbi:MAG: amidohydrolase family protein [Microbacterium sp.]
MQTLHGVRVWDGETDLGGCDISWAEDRIVAVAASAPDTPSCGLSLIPGLVDTHVHLDTDAITPRIDRAWAIVTPPEERSLHVLAHAQTAMRHGVTTLRDLASESAHFAVSRVLESGVVTGPRLLTAGPVGMTAGHGDLFTPPHYPHRPPVADSPDECRRLVRQWARAGAHAIKLYTSGGVLSMGDRVEWRNQTDAELAATVDEAHALGMLVAAHSHTSAGVERALAAGVDSIEHGTDMTIAQMETIAERRIPVAPTLLIHDRIHERAEEIPTPSRQKSSALEQARERTLREAGRRGVRFVLGTDANGVFTRFGEQMTEVRIMARRLGWDAERALTAATSDAADAIGMGERIGRIRPGWAPDMVLMAGTPWREIAELDTARIRAVVSRGKVVSGALPGQAAA